MKHPTPDATDDPLPSIPPDVARALNINGAGGRAARDRLQRYVGLLLKWQSRINLIGPATIADVWHRHILDCGQLAALLPNPSGRVCDLGSGAGLPGLVLAALGVGEGGGSSLDLVESDARKAAFLTEANRLMGTGARILNRRAESLEPNSPAPTAGGPYDVITARALAPLPRLLSLSENLLKTGGKLLFLKGKAADAELTESAKTWKMTVNRMPSASDPAGVILMIEDFARRHG